MIIIMQITFSGRHDLFKAVKFVRIIRECYHITSSAVIRAVFILG